MLSLSQHRSRSNNSRIGFWILCAVVIGSVSFLAGCGEPSSTTKNNSANDLGNSQNDLSDLTANQIFSQMVAAYRNAEQYSDQAVLYMSYRMSGRPVQEPQPWAVSIDSQGQFAAKLFNAQVECNGESLSCFVYDIESGNLDNQQLVIPVVDRLPLTDLYEDKIAGHFITGYSEMPLDTSLPLESARLVPPTIGLLTGQLPPAWLKTDAKVERFEDSEIDGRACYVLRCQQSEIEGDFVDLWIDQQNNVLWQAALPVTILAEKVRTASEIENLRLVARFHKASFGVQEGAFPWTTRDDARKVSQFVKIPEPLPTEIIGAVVPEFKLLTQSSRPLNRDDFRGKTTTFLWLGNDGSIDEIYQFDQLAKNIPGDQQNYAVIYSEPHRASYETDVHAMNMALNEAARKTKMPFYFDKDLTTSAQFRLKSIPMAIVMDKDSKVQFATGLESGWREKLQAAIERIGTGESIADEMLSEYQQFLERYHTQLAAMAIQPKSGSASQTNLIPVSQKRERFSSLWANESFKKSGNVLPNPDGSCVIVDGWRSIVHLNKDGEVLARKVLQLPEEAAVSIIRKGNIDGKETFAAFMPQSAQVFLFSGDWEPVGVYPSSPSGRVRDVQFLGSELLVAFEGQSVSAFDLVNGGSRDLKSGHIESLCSNGLWGVRKGQIVELETGEKFDLPDWQASRLFASGDQLCCLAVGKEGDWQAIGIDANQNVIWNVSVGPQDFGANVEPISSINSGAVRWAILNSDHGVHLLNADGRWIGDFDGRNVTGAALVGAPESPAMVVSEGNRVVKYAIKNAAK